MMREQGVVVPSAADWVLSDVNTTFSLILGGFLWGAFFSKHLDTLGPRRCGLLGAASLGSGFTLASVAVAQHNLPMLLAGGLVWGCANGLAYMLPIANLMKWYPERKGFAAGLVTVGFGSGALVTAPLFQHLLGRYQEPPEFLGPVDSVPLVVGDSGRLYTQDTGQEVVVATVSDVAKSFDGLIDAGVYLVGSGSTGVSQAFLTLGLAYSSLMIISAFSYREPPPQYQADPPSNATKPSETVPPLTISEATRTPQFFLLFTAFVTANSGAYGLISSIKLILSTSFPTLTNDQLTGFVAGTSMANLTGRLLFSNWSDYYVKKNPQGVPFEERNKVFTWIWGVFAPVGYLGILTAIHGEGTFPDPARLGIFSIGTFMVLSSFGGSASVRPPLMSDLYGPTHTAALTARQTSSVVLSSVLGPKLVGYFSHNSTVKEIHRLSDLVGDAEFQKSFGGASKDSLDTLIESKTVTIPRILELCPSDTVDPSPFVYDHGLMAAFGLALFGFTNNFMVRPLSKVPQRQANQTLP